jgi:nucleotide-binding universal stress UspA family protein
MSYKTIAVNLAVDADPLPIIRLGAELAHRFDALLVGLAAAAVPPLVSTGDGLVYEGEVMQIERAAIERRLAELRGIFETSVPRSIPSEWVQEVDSPTQVLCRLARRADLIVAAGGGDDVFRAVDIGSLVLAAGRPVLSVAANAEHMLGQTVLVAWKDGREARRALSDALPFLVKANKVAVATMEAAPGRSGDNGLSDVAAFLRRHGVTAHTEVIAGDADGGELAAFARSIHADLIVSGAYGHSRLREWVFGGVTRSLLGESEIHRLLSS